MECERGLFLLNDISMWKNNKENFFYMIYNVNYHVISWEITRETPLHRTRSPLNLILIARARDNFFLFSSTRVANLDALEFEWSTRFKILILSKKCENCFRRRALLHLPCNTFFVWRLLLTPSSLIFFSPCHSQWLSHVCLRVSLW